MTVIERFNNKILPQIRRYQHATRFCSVMTRRRGRRRRKLLERRGYSHWKGEALDRTMWRNRFRGGFGPVVRQNTE